MAAPSRGRRGAGDRTGSTSGANLGGGRVVIVGLDDLRRELRRLEDPKGWTKKLSGLQRTIAREAAGWARSEAAGMGGPFAHFANAIRGYGTVSGARIGIGNGNANATFWGAKKRTGWNAGNGGKAQHPSWVGASWDVGVHGQGPYAINQAIANHLPDIIDRYSEGIDDITRRAFPD